MNVTPQLLSFSQIMARMKNSPIQAAEIPVEHSISLAMPTRRFGQPAYAFFAAPSARIAGQTPVLAPPDRWWVVAAHGGRLLCYTLVSITSFAPDVTLDPITVDPRNQTIADLRKLQADITELMDLLASVFFAGDPGDPAIRRSLFVALDAFLPIGSLPRYRALAPDFFAWLEA